MAENKKSFVLYADLLTVFEKFIIRDRENKTNYAGELIYHVLLYVNDKNPVPVDFIIEMAFEPIKLQLKRDLLKYELIKEKRSEAGKASAEKKKQDAILSTSVDFVDTCSTLSTVNVNDNATVNVNDILAGPPTNIDKAKVFEYLRSSTNRQFISKEQCEQEADLLVEKFNGNQIGNLKTLCISWAGKMIPWPKPGTKLKSSFT